MKIASHHDKQLTPSESWDQDVFFEPGFGVSSNSNCQAKKFTTLWHTFQGKQLDRFKYTKKKNQLNGNELWQSQ